MAQTLILRYQYVTIEKLIRHTCFNLVSDDVDSMEWSLFSLSSVSGENVTCADEMSVHRVTPKITYSNKQTNSVKKQLIDRPI